MWGRLVFHVHLETDYERPPKVRVIRGADILVKEKGRDRIGHSGSSVMCNSGYVQPKAFEILLGGSRDLMH